MKAWAIKKWYDTFEHAATRKLKNLNYVGLPLDMGSLRYLDLMETTSGAAAFGHFIALVEFAATLPCRGLLVRSDRALTREQIAKAIGAAAAPFRRSWDLLADPKIGWVMEVEIGSVPTSFVFSAADSRQPLVADARQKSPTDPPCACHESPIPSLPPSLPEETYTHKRAGARGSSSVPPGLDAPEFHAAWGRWKAHRDALGMAAISPMSEAGMWQRMGSWGLQRALAAIQNSIEHNWRRIVEPNGDEYATTSGTAGAQRGGSDTGGPGSDPGATPARAGAGPRVGGAQGAFPGAPKGGCYAVQPAPLPR